jgi:MoaA/NifB/PqqE/SkfB family radical SAM enzyme
MDPFIDPEALDPKHPLTPRKLDNLARADAAHRELAVRVNALPCKLTLQTTDVCNLDCPHCQIPRAQKTAAMRPELLGWLRDQLLSDLIELHPTNLGEPFAWPHFRALCRDLAECGVVLDLTTNGTLLSPDRVEWIAPIARDVKVSFDGATAPTFERFRRGASFAAVCDNVRGLVARFRRVRVRRPIVALQMTLMRDNVDELPALLRLAHELGVDRVKAYHLFSFTPAMDEQSLMGHLGRYEEDILPEALALGAALGVDLQLAEPSGGDPGRLRPQVCHLPWHETWIDVDGAVLLCHSHGGEVAGQLQRFEDAWNGPLHRRVRAAFAAGAPIGACDGCGMNLGKSTEHEAVPYDPGSFVRLRRSRDEVGWSGRMRQFELRRRGDR